jgi:hypothetical protein
MPVKMEMLPGDQVRVSTPGGVKAKATSFQKAMAQKRLLNAVDHGWTPGRRRSTAGKAPMYPPVAKPMKPMISPMKPPKGMPKGMM